MVEYSLDLQNINLSAIRTVRVLRPLKAINRVPSELPLGPSPCPLLHSEKTDRYVSVPGLCWARGSFRELTGVPCSQGGHGPFGHWKVVLAPLSPEGTWTAAFWGVWFAGTRLLGRRALAVQVATCV